MELKKILPIRNPNYKLLPVNVTDDVDEFNQILEIYRKRDLENPYKLIKRTKSGGISKINFYGHQLDLTSTKWSAELTVLDYDGFFRLQFRHNINDDLDTTGKKYSGMHSLNKFAYELKRIGIELSDYALSEEEAIEAKATIESPLIECPNKLFLNREFSGPIYHLDRRSSYPAGLKEYKPEFAPIIDRWFDKKENGEVEYKAYLNLLIGTMQSKYVKYKYADMANYAIRRNNEELKKMSDELKANGDTVLLYNTDGIWFKGDYIPKTGNGLGDFRVDYVASKFRIKSDGAYEFVGYDPNKETEAESKYYPKIRGKTRYDIVKPRDEWVWGDIYNEEASEILKYKVTWEKGIEVIYRENR